MDILHVEAGEIQGIRRFAFALATLFADNRSPDTTLALAIERQAQVCQLPAEVLRILELERLHLVVLEAVAGASIPTLLAIQLIGRFIPNITHIVDAEVILDTILGNQDMPFVRRFRNLCEFHSGFVHQFFKGLLVFYLNQDTRIFSEENLDDVFFLNLVQVYFQTTFHIGKAHFQQGGNHTTGGNIMPSQNQSLLDSILNGIERLTKIVGILHRRNLIAQTVQGLSKGRTTQLQRIEREVYIINVRIAFMRQDRRNNLPDIAHFRTG